MNHKLTLTTTECLLLIGSITTMPLGEPQETVERLSDKIKERVLYDLKQAEIERNKWKDIDK